MRLVWQAVVGTSFLCFSTGERSRIGGENKIADTTSSMPTVKQTPGLSSHQVFVGIDVGYKSHVACACPGVLFNTKRYPDGWKRAKTVHFSSDATGFNHLQRYLDKLSSNSAEFLILCEPTGGYYGLALQIYLLGKGYTILQITNSAVKDYRENVYGSQTKTDDMDARLMARMGFLHEWVGEEFSLQEVRLVRPDDSMIGLISHDLLRLNAEISRRKSQLHQILSYTFPELKSFFLTDVTGKAARKLIKQYPTPQELKNASVEDIAQLFREGHDYKHDKRANELITLAQKTVGIQMVSHHIWRQNWLLDQLEVLEEAREALLTQQSQLIASHPYTPIIESLPIKSPIWTASLIGVICNIERFHNYAQFRAYMGWFPKVAQSGTSINSSKLSHKGARLGRRVFGQMALVLISPKVQETPFRIYYDRLVSRGMPAHAALGHLATKLANVLYMCLKTMTPYDEAKHRKQMGLPVENEVGKSVLIDIHEADQEPVELSELPLDTSPTSN